MKNPTSTVTGFDFKKIKELYKSNISDSIDNGQSKVKYYCMKCGNEHREIACPKYGSKMKRVGLWFVLFVKFLYNNLCSGPFTILIPQE
jgi:hypothetical protein